MAATAWRRCTRFEHPPTIVASTRAACDSERVGDEGREVRDGALARDSVDVGRPQPTVVEPAGRPRSPARVTTRDGADLGGLRHADDRRSRRASRTSRAEHRQRRVPHKLSNTTSTARSGAARRDRFDPDEVREHAWALLEFHDRDDVRRGEAGCGAMVDHVTVERPVARGPEHLDVVVRTAGAERLGREVRPVAPAAPLQPELPSTCPPRNGRSRAWVSVPVETPAASP